MNLDRNTLSGWYLNCGVGNSLSDLNYLRRSYIRNGGASPEARAVYEQRGDLASDMSSSDFGGGLPWRGREGAWELETELGGARDPPAI
jgi:hypothetical protein